MITLLLFPFVTTFLWYLGSAATITLPIRERLPTSLNQFLLCPACSGFWYGLGLGAYAIARDLTVWPPELTLVGMACASGVWTAYGAGLLLKALTYRDEVLSRQAENDLAAGTDDIQAG